MKSLLLESVEYKVERSGFGVWRRYLYQTASMSPSIQSVWDQSAVDPQAVAYFQELWQRLSAEYFF